MSQSSESEWQTRKQRIDPRLKACGWEIVPFDRAVPPYQRKALEEYPTANGPADYALCLNGIVYGVVEAKKLTIGPQNVLTQAERYSRGVSGSPLDYSGGYHVPFLYSTNGEAIWFHDVRHPLNRSRKIADFHTPDALLEMMGRNFEQECAWLTANPSNHPWLRPYQKDANTEVETAIRGRKRQMLVAMATGTGKTVTMVSQIYRLMKAGAARRILFLVDRRALAAQAVRAFASFEAEPGLKFDRAYEVYSQRFKREDLEDEPYDPKVLPNHYLTAPKPGHAFVYISTIQRMTINLFGRGAVFNGEEDDIDADADKLDIPIHAFDLIVADECHRGYSSKELSIWRQTLDHFDAIKIGLTATPAAHTKAYFQEVVFRYEYERAVREGHLVDYDLVKIASNVRMNGVFLREGEQVGTIDTRTGEQQFDYLEDERQFDTTEIEQKVTSPDSNRKILEAIRQYGEEHEAKYGRFPKTLIFADNDLPHTSHADQLVNIARDVFGRGDTFVQKITGRVDRPLQRIREFRNREDVGIVVSVDMLTTGVDIPDLEYIVFLRPVKSRILFEQMLGRGTRKGEKYPNKSHFTVFDCFNGTLIDYFRQATAITAEPPESDTKTIVQVIEEIWQNRDRDYNIRRLVKRLQRIDKEMSGEARDRFAAHIPDGDLATYAAGLPDRLKTAFTDTMKLLRDKDFQHLLLNYPRAQRVFTVAIETEDQVTSEWLVREGGKEYRPEDYLQAFSRFVTERAAEVDAIQILLERPQDWGVEPLKQLREKLKAGNFTEDNLQRAAQVRHHKALADIISLVKKAVDEGAPLLTAEERVNQALAQVTAGQTFTEEQQRWLGRIRAHLVQNLSVDQVDFDLIPALSDPGGWGKANRVFQGRLDSIIQQINEAIAA